MNNLCVFDFETDGSDPWTCSPIQLSAVMVDTKKLCVIPESSFNGYMRPYDIDEEEYVNKHYDTLKWRSDLDKIPIDELINTWKHYPQTKMTWELFVQYVDKYNLQPSKKTIFTAPNPGGYNIAEFDMIIIHRLCKAFGPFENNRQKLFFSRDIRDAMHLTSYWLQNERGIKSFSFDSIREYFGISAIGAHDALIDCKQTADLIIRYMEFAKNVCLQNGIKFKGAFKNK